jgi:aspartyl-tRNA(Asn)/glutamyl-tRNA(Gln) amidotransferase subunit C
MKPRISIDRVSELAHLKLEEEEKAKLSAQLAKIVEWVSKLEELELNDSKGEVSSPLSFCLPLREDKPQPSLPTEDVLSNSPEKTGKLIRVPKVIESK